MHVNNFLFMGIWEHVKIGESPPSIIPKGSSTEEDPSSTYILKGQLFRILQTKITMTSFIPRPKTEDKLS
jgi:hypothetical protein